MSLLGLDVGTSGCKALVVDEAGNVRGQAYREYAMLSPEPGLAELDPEQVWTAVKAVIRQVASDAGREVRAISVASFGEAFVALDGGGRVLSNSLLYIDPRGADEAERLSRSMDERAIHALTGTTAHAMYSLPKMMWYRNNRPQLHARAWKYLLFSGFVLFRLGAEPHTDHSLAARTLAFDVVGKTWAEALLGHADIDRGLLGDPVASGMPVGRLRPELATELGLPSGVLLVSGGHDQPCAALGAGAVRAGAPG